jgi:NADH-ubiquinone oxidoreductase chain 5
LISGLAIFVAGLGANFEYDLRKMIVLTALRQLGLIMRILCWFLWVSFFQLTHAVFKALLFICVGVIPTLKDS